jgi:hypothetical protein
VSDHSCTIGRTVTLPSGREVQQLVWSPSDAGHPAHICVACEGVAVKPRTVLPAPDGRVVMCLGCPDCRVERCDVFTKEQFRRYGKYLEGRISEIHPDDFEAFVSRCMAELETEAIHDLG